MATAQELINELKAIVNILEDEKEALLENDGHRVADILERKNNYIENLNQYKGLDILNNKKAMELIGEINSIQETNILLTKQALSYQDMLLESIAKNINNLNNTYTPNKGYNQQNNISFIDQSV